MKHIRQLFILFSILSLAACKKAPEFPKTPEIAFLRIDKKTIFKSKGPETPPDKQDSLTIVLTFKDGDGDLGSNDNNNENYKCRLLVKQNGVFSELVDSLSRPVDKNGTFLPLGPDGGRLGPIEGELYYGPSMSSLGLYEQLQDSNNIIVKFEVYIKDNSGNVSNTIQTSEVLFDFFD